MPGFIHRPVMLREVLEWLQPRVGAVFVDGTAGGGGHCAAILEASGPTGRLWAFDRDGEAVAAVRERLRDFSERVEVVQSNFDRMAEVVPAGTVAGVVLDLGMSSPQLDQPERGFGFLHDGALDMRMDQRGGMTAAQFLAEQPAEELARIFWENADERDSRRIAKAIVAGRSVRPLVSTLQLAELVERVCPRRGRKSHPATRVFQALRIEVNDEIGSLRRGLVAAMTVLADRGRLLVVTFDSLADRVTKGFFRDVSREYEVLGDVDVPMLRRPRVPGARVLTRKAVMPGESEVRENPRARSAQLRVLEKMGNGVK
ncbi:MAG: 16S rRNA (cytosine(1402)-N(4))-methyltransferase RsmH [Pedosphaera sp.]|nr:16S rRNA (cytosine(1402)-N(4))-methyltransferase RsmH [Pedosphaera sp.]